mgnify:CR=1 FL=1
MKDSPSITIRRDNIFQMLLDLYQDKSFCLHAFPFMTFAGEKGEDFNGLKREVYTLFWQQTYIKLFEGAGSHIPMSTPEVTDELLTKLGRIASHGFVVSGVFPLNISKPFILSSLHCDTTLTDDELLNSFLQFHTEKERGVLANALTYTSGRSFPEDIQEELVDILEAYNFRRIPTPSTLKPQLVTIARRELVHKVSWAAKPFGQGLADCHDMWQDVTRQEVDHLYATMMPTSKAILGLLRVDEATITIGQKTVMGYMKRFIRNADEATLTKTLRFVTGCDTITVDAIDVTFHRNIGTIPEITAHTCSATLDLPSNGYVSFSDFQSQLMSILNSSEAWVFNVV